MKLKRSLRKGVKYGVQHVHHLRHTAEEIRIETKGKIGTAIAAAFAFVMALTWNEAIKQLMTDFLEYFHLAGGGYFYKFLAAIITSIICILAIIYFSRWSAKN